MTGHEYGPHDPENAPGMVEVWPMGRYAEPQLRPIAPGVRKQRERINDLAHEASRRHG